MIHHRFKEHPYLVRRVESSRCSCSQNAARPRTASAYSHSIVAGGLPVMS
jgi:hypothetical protein